MAYFLNRTKIIHCPWITAKDRYLAPSYWTQERYALCTSLKAPRLFPMPLSPKFEFFFFMKQEGEPLLIIYLKIEVTKTSTGNQETKKVR
jgi:hypothetical protein